MGVVFLYATHKDRVTAELAAVTAAVELCAAMGSAFELTARAIFSHHQNSEAQKYKFDRYFMIMSWLVVIAEILYSTNQPAGFHHSAFR